MTDVVLTFHTLVGVEQLTAQAVIHKSGAIAGPSWGTMGFDATPTKATGLGGTLYRPSAVPLKLGLTGSNGPAFAGLGFRLVQTIRNAGGLPQQNKVTAIARSGGKVTFTMSGPHGFVPGDMVFANSCDPYSGIWQVEQVPSTTQVQITHADNGAGALGAITALSVYPDDTAHGGQGWAAYQAKIADSIVGLGPANMAWIVVENEATLLNQTLFSDDPSRYGQMIARAKAAAAPYGVKVTNDGMLAMVVKGGVYMDLVATKGQAVADQFSTDAGVNPGTANANAIKCRAWLDQVVSGGADAANIHMYGYRTSLAVKQAMDWVGRYTGLPVVCNEFGQLPGSTPATVDLMFDGLKAAAPGFVVLYAQGGNLSDTLKNTDGSLNALGQEWAIRIGG